MQPLSGLVMDEVRGLIEHPPAPSRPRLWRCARYRSVSPDWYRVGVKPKCAKPLQDLASFEDLNRRRVIDRRRQRSAPRSAPLFRHRHQQAGRASPQRATPRTRFSKILNWRSTSFLCLDSIAVDDYPPGSDGRPRLGDPIGETKLRSFCRLSDQSRVRSRARSFPTDREA